MCGSGEYAEEGAGFCSTVRAGEEVVKDGELRVGAANCTAGHYSTGSVDSCTSCGTGFSDAGASKCEFCGPGEYMREESMIKVCSKCVAGKFSETGAYRNLKKMLASKNDTIKQIRKKLDVYEPEVTCDDEKEED